MRRDTKHILNIMATIINIMIAVFMIYNIEDRTFVEVFTSIIVMIFITDFRNYMNTAIPTKDDK